MLLFFAELYFFYDTLFLHFAMSKGVHTFYSDSSFLMKSAFLTATIMSIIQLFILFIQIIFDNFVMPPNKHWYCENITCSVLLVDSKLWPFMVDTLPSSLKCIIKSGKFFLYVFFSLHHPTFFFALFLRYFDKTDFYLFRVKR